MQRNIIIALAAVILMLAGVLAFVLQRDQPRAIPMSVNAADENATEPYHQEMDCIDRLMENNDLEANQIGPALARCQVGSPTARGNGQ